MKSHIEYLSNVRPAMIAIICFAYFVIAVTGLYFLNPDYNLIRSFTGNYDLGSYEFLIASTFFSLGMGSIALSFGLYQGMAQSTRSWTGLFLVSIWGVGMLVAGVFPANEGGGTLPHIVTVLIAGIFPIDVEAYPETTFSLIHILALVLSLPILSLGTLLLSRRFKQDNKWHSIHSISLILAVTLCISSILFFPTLFFPSLLIFKTYGPLVFIFIGLVIGIIWLLLITARLGFLFKRAVSN